MIAAIETRFWVAALAVAGAYLITCFLLARARQRHRRPDL
jgi:hypothetical protein